MLEVNCLEKAESDLLLVNPLKTKSLPLLIGRLSFLF